MVKILMRSARPAKQVMTVVQFSNFDTEGQTISGRRRGLVEVSRDRLLSWLALGLFLATPSVLVGQSPLAPLVGFASQQRSDEARSGGGWVTEPAASDLVEFKTFESAAVGGDVSYHVYLPSAYQTERQQRFPVIYWLHGSGPGIKGIPFLASYFRDAMDSGRMPPAIVVFANGLPDGMWCDSKDGTVPVEAMFVEDLIPHVDRSYRTIASREGRVIEGFSMGGYGAGRLALKHADKFRAVSMLGAGPLQANFLEDDPDLQPMELRRRLFAMVYGNDPKYFEAKSPWRLAERRAGALPSDFRLRIVVGADDHLRDNNREFSRHLTSLGIKHDYAELPGVGHDAMGTLAGSEDQAMAFYRAVLPAR
jgi:enterochelin esterase-like enzyme